MDVLEEERLAFAEELEEVALQLSLQDPALDSLTRIQQVREEYERLSMAADMFSLPEISALVSRGTASLDTDAAVELLHNGKYFGWLEMTALTFREPEEVSHLPLLIAELSDPLWPESLAPDQLQSFLLSLRPDVLGDTDLAADAESESDTPDNPLAFAADIHPELLAAFMEETPGHISEAARLIRLIAIGANDKAQHKQAARLTHTIKGSSSVVGVAPITRFTHRLEDLLEFSLKPVPQGLGDTLEASADCLEALFDNLQSDTGLPAEYAGLNVALSEWLERLNVEQAERDQDQELPELKALTELPDFLLDDKAATEDADAVEADGVASDGLGSAMNTVVAAVPPLKLSEDRIQDMLSLTGELITSTSMTAEVLQQTRSLSAQLYQQDEQIRQRLDELEGLVDQQKRQLEVGAGSGDKSQKQRSATSAQQISQASPVSQISRMAANHREIESYSDLYSTTNLLTEAAADSREMAHELQNNIRKLSDGLYQQQRVQRQLSVAVLGLRLASVGGLTARIERIVRETCRQTGKQATIMIHGQDLQVDTDILKGLTDPLLHLLRNAVDHGIEMPEQRAAAGKPEMGTITLDFSQSGNYVTLVLRDDGAGLDVERIRARAIERGLLRADETVTDEALLRLILLPGFSTLDAVSDVSGRGVGMDVVQSAIESLRGTLKLDSTQGEGTAVSITLPQTLIATHALIVRAGGNQLAIPADSVEQLLYVSAGESIIDEQGWRIETERYQMPVLRLADVLQWDSEPTPRQSSYTLLIVRNDATAYAIYVEDVLPSRDIVINSLAPWLNSIHCIQGACILANGVVAPVLDMMRLLHEMESGLLPVRQGGGEGSVANTAQISTVLVVDDSLSNRKSMSLMLEGMGYAVHTAVDGMDALKLMNNIEVDLILTDLEMPRMSGLEMTQAIRIWPEMKHLPVVMITSRGTQKHRTLAAEAGVDGYLTKPVQTILLEQEVQKWLDTRMGNREQTIND